MTSVHRPTLRELMRATAVCIALVFVVSVVSLAYAAGRHSGHQESSQQGGAASR